MSLICSLIARNKDIVLSEKTEFSGNFQQIMRIVLQKQVKENFKSIIQYDNYKIYYVNHNNITIMLLGEGLKDSIAFSFISEVEKGLLETVNEDELNNCNQFQLTKGTKILEKYMQYYNAGQITTTTGEIIEDLNLAKSIAIENIEKVLEREEKMKIIATKSENLQGCSMSLNTYSDSIRRAETSKKNKFVMYAVLIIGVLVILFVFIL